MKIKFLAAAIFAAIVLYFLGAFIVTPPFSTTGFFVCGQCACRHRTFININSGSVYLYFTVHDQHYNLGKLIKKDGNLEMPATRKSPALRLLPSFWGIATTDLQTEEVSFYSRDYLYPLSFWTMHKSAEQGAAANP